ncbi:hypothetical protein GCM10010270_34510 [Streptomyces violaceus]|nr:hypothetical protein GCM10010270_34510 [Streptomyces janthinus]
MSVVGRISITAAASSEYRHHDSWCPPQCSVNPRPEQTNYGRVRALARDRGVSSELCHRPVTAMSGTRDGVNQKSELILFMIVNARYRAVGAPQLSPSEGNP